MQKSLSSKLFSALLLMVGLLLFNTCAINPVTGKKELSLMSTQKEIEMGTSYDPQVVAQYGLYENDQIQQFITTKGKEMAAISHRPNLPYEFKVLDSPIINAFAVPGGFVYFTRGILAHFNNEAEFAGVLGHEIGHITARHSAKQYTKQMVAQVGFIAGVIASEQFRNYADVAQTSLGLLFLKFGRDAESQSDRLGVEYSTKIGYDAIEMANFFNTLKRMRGDAEAPPTMLSTHPDPGDRYNKVGQLAQKWQAKNPGVTYDVNRDQYLRMIDGLTYGEDPRQGYFDDGKFFHPELKFEFPVPRDWQSLNSPQAVQMGQRDGKALMVLRIAQGQSLDQAAQSFVQENQLTLMNSTNRRVNGFNSVQVMASQPSQQDQSGNASPELRILSFFYEYNGLIYQMIGVSSAADYGTFSRDFENTMTNFRQLTDPNRINVKPEKVKVVKVNRSSNLRSILQSNGTPADRLEEVAILNSMELNDNIQSGTLIKVIGK